MALYGIAWAFANTIAPVYGTQVIAAWGYDTLWVLLAIQALAVWIGFWYLGKRTNATSGQ
jgi:phosphate/sulfate permease